MAIQITEYYANPLSNMTAVAKNRT